MLTLEDKKTVEWLEKLLGNMYDKARSDPGRFVDLAFVLEDMKQALKNIKSVTSSEERRQEVKEAKEKKARSSYTPNLCPEHPTYSGQRVPTIDCEGHWAAYKKMNPLKYEAARRKYDRIKKSNSN